ncbi:MAG: hypothetical protein H6907_07970 [Hyphomicrobiales bacterium]|nr:hypothetical protein [Hyphomicrobiales bacterium]MCP5371656.1 hypothetical protein [Hyphomicrobiales bacterium]
MNESSPGRNEPLSELERVAQAATDALTDGIVERLSVTGVNALEIVDRLNDDQTRDAVHKVLDRLTELNNIGAVDTLFDAVTVIHSARSAATDAMVERFFIFIEHMINNLGTEELALLAHNARRAMEEAADEHAGRKPSGGMLKAVSLLSKPRTIAALEFFLTFACRMQERTQQHRHDPENLGN